MTKYLLVPDEDILSAARPVVQQLRLREAESGSRSPATVVSGVFLLFLIIILFILLIGRRFW